MYIPIIKTGEAEVKAVENLSAEMIAAITPIIELTRGRQKTESLGDEKKVTFPYNKRLSKVKESFKGRTVFFDLTSDENLISNEIYELYDYSNGYDNWCTFVENNVGEESFRKIIPSILFNWNDDKFEDNFKLQIQRLSRNCKSMMYRSSIQTKDCYDELPMILGNLPDGCELWIVLDGGYLQDSAVDIAFKRCTKRIQNIRNEILRDKNVDVNFVIAATSYPESVFDYGLSSPITIIHSEVRLFEELREVFPNIVYGDYAGINPIRKDLVVMARGWIPRIDIPLIYETKVYWKRRPKGITEYKSTYVRVAEEAVNDEQFPMTLRDKWGYDKIVSCAGGYVTSCVPSFWISVRVYNHIYQQIQRLCKSDNHIVI